MNFDIIATRMLNIIELDNKELIGQRTNVHYLISELEYWSVEMVHYWQVVPYLAVP